MTHELSETVEIDGQHFIISGRTGEVLEGPFLTAEEADARARARSRFGPQDGTPPGHHEFDTPPAAPSPNPFRDAIVTRGQLLPLGRTGAGELRFAMPQSILDLIESFRLPGDVLTGRREATPEQATEFAFNFLAPATTGGGFGRGLGTPMAPAAEAAARAAPKPSPARALEFGTFPRRDLPEGVADLDAEMFRRAAEQEIADRAGAHPLQQFADTVRLREEQGLPTPRQPADVVDLPVGTESSAAILRRREAAQASGKAVDQALAEMEFSARATGKPDPATLARLEQAVAARNGPEHAARLMKRVRDKFGLAEAEAPAPEPRESVIDALRGMGEGRAPQEGGIEDVLAMRQAEQFGGRLDEQNLRNLGVEEYPENVVTMAEVEGRRTLRQRQTERDAMARNDFIVFDPATEQGVLKSFKTEAEARAFVERAAEGGRVLDYGRFGDINPTLDRRPQSVKDQEFVAGAVDFAQRTLADAEARAVRARDYVARVKKPSAEPEALRRTAVNQRAKEAGLEITPAKVAGGRFASIKDRVIETISRQGDVVAQLYTNPDTGAVLLYAKPGFRIPFGTREEALRFIMQEGYGRRAAVMSQAQLRRLGLRTPEDILE